MKTFNHPEHKAYAGYYIDKKAELQIVNNVDETISNGDSTP